MAMYHFRIKSDKRANGSTINAVSHAKYINREDEYINIDSKQELANQKFSNNTISGNKTMPEANEMELLYKSPLGSIIGEHGDIYISDHPSHATVDIGLMYAYKQNDGHLHVDGTSEFKAQVILCAADLNLDVKFDDPEMQDVFEELKKDYDTPIKGNRNNSSKIKSEFEIPNFSGAFDRLLYKNPFEKLIEEPDYISDEYDELFAGESETSTNTTKGYVKTDSSHEHDYDIFAPEAPSSIFEPTYNTSCNDTEDQNLEIRTRRTISISRIRRAEKISMDILLTSTGMTKGADHAAYINRKERFASRGGCVYTDSHLPSWAKDAKDFFTEADKNERINGCRYKEIEFALPNELNLEQQKEIVNTFIDHHLKDFYYAYAVHEKIGALSNGQKHPHVHIMFSERKLDEYEKQHERARGLFFRTAARKDPATGGCKKDPKFNGKYRMSYLRYMRQDFANIQNAILAKYGYSVRVDHRTLKAQREDALERGDVELAKLLDRLPERSVGPIAAQNPNNNKVICLAKHRKLKEDKALNIYCQDIIEDCTTAVKAFNAILELDSAIKLLKKSEDVFQHSTYNYNDMLDIVVARRNNTAKAYEKTTLFDEAVKMAISKRMSIKDAEKYDRMTELADARKNLREFITSYPAPDDNTENYEAYTEIRNSMNEQISDYTKQLTSLAKELQPTFVKLREPDHHKLIHDDVREILAKEYDNKKHLKKLAEETDIYVDMINGIVKNEQERIDTQEKIKEANSPNPEYTSQQLLEYTIENRKIILDRMKDIMEIINDASNGNISEAAARNMAISIYTNKESKKLNAECRTLKKEKKQLEGARQELENIRSWEDSIEYSDAYEKMKNAYNKRLNNYEERLAKYESAKKALEIRCNTPEAKGRINEITMKILSKNLLNYQYCENLKAELNSLKAQNNSYKTQIQGLRKQIATDRKIQNSIHRAPKYSLSSSTPIPTGKRKSYTPSLLAGFLGGDEHMANLRGYVQVDAATARFLESAKTEAEIEMDMD